MYSVFDRKGNPLRGFAGPLLSRQSIAGRHPLGSPKEMEIPHFALLCVLRVLCSSVFVLSRALRDSPLRPYHLGGDCSKKVLDKVRKKVYSKLLVQSQLIPVTPSQHSDSRHLGAGNEKSGVLVGCLNQPSIIEVQELVPILVLPGERNLPPLQRRNMPWRPNQQR
jgi:hypothetical protein